LLSIKNSRYDDLLLEILDENLVSIPHVFERLLEIKESVVIKTLINNPKINFYHPNVFHLARIVARRSMTGKASPLRIYPEVIERQVKEKSIPDFLLYPDYLSVL